MKYTSFNAFRNALVDSAHKIMMVHALDFIFKLSIKVIEFGLNSRAVSRYY